jgi:hypothetical protein
MAGMEHITKYELQLEHPCSWWPAVLPSAELSLCFPLVVLHCDTQVENANLSRLVNGHSDYLTVMDEILEVINMHDA